MRAPDAGLDVALLRDLMGRPEPWTRGEARFWDEPQISAHMLEAHLDPDISTICCGWISRGVAHGEDLVHEEHVGVEVRGDGEAETVVVGG